MVLNVEIIKNYLCKTNRFIYKQIKTIINKLNEVYNYE